MQIEQNLRELWATFIALFRMAGISDYIDIALVAYLIYRAMKLLRDTAAFRLAKGIFVLFLVMATANFFYLNTISWVFEQVMSYGLISAFIIFQPELRRMLEQLGKGSVTKILMGHEEEKGDVESMITAVVAACGSMSQTKTGALIVCERQEKLGEIVKTGTQVDAAPSPELIKNVFFHNSPLHDGAMIVRNGRVLAAGCVLPLSGSQNLSRDLGTRHRAAVGMSESSDAVLVVVSEETGGISVAIGGMLKRHLTPELLRKVLVSELMNEGGERKKTAVLGKWKVKK
ncbi:MAG: TIGR00159 family protein [Clostridiaceae bacterium]|nr:TIGR00159 family protein [Clostridiaceae bacterium]MCI9483250.1 TIGR00159 family protein [Clostridiaceae bacterium]NBH76931.1 TIGR00159 family protein [Clostridiaceae bacterium]NBI80793.1 TIGR00159 family protein [Clostridiaceae bacterium]